MITGKDGEGPLHTYGDPGHWTHSSACLLRKIIKNNLKEETDWNVQNIKK